MEHIIVSNIWKHLHKRDIILHFQHGFQSGLSCESQLIETVHDWMTALDNKTQIDAILLDFAKAFDKVPHKHAENEHWRLVEDRNGQVGYAPAAFLVVILDTAEEEEESDATKKGLENGTEENRIGQEGERRKSYSAAVIDGIKRKSRIFVGDSIVRKTDTRLSKEEDVVVCLPGARIEHVTERVEKIMGRGKGGTILVHIGTNNADKEGTTTIVDKYRKLLKKTKEARVEQIILSGILPVFGNRIDGYRNSKRMAINGMVKRLCKEENVGYVDLWDSVVGKEGMYARDGLHLSGKGAAVFAEGLSGAVASGLGKVRYLN